MFDFFLDACSFSSMNKIHVLDIILNVLYSQEKKGNEIKFHFVGCSN